MIKDLKRSETIGMILLKSVDVRTKSGISVKEPGFNWHLQNSFYSLTPILLNLFFSTKKEIIYLLPVR